MTMCCGPSWPSSLYPLGRAGHCKWSQTSGFHLRRLFPNVLSVTWRLISSNILRCILISEFLLSGTKEQGVLSKDFQFYQLLKSLWHSWHNWGITYSWNIQNIRKIIKLLSLLSIKYYSAIALDYSCMLIENNKLPQDSNVKKLLKNVIHQQSIKYFYRMVQN